jgi:hypothetical protein
MDLRSSVEDGMPVLRRGNIENAIVKNRNLQERNSNSDTD